MIPNTLKLSCIDFRSLVQKNTPDASIVSKLFANLIFFILALVAAALFAITAV